MDKYRGASLEPKLMFAGPTDKKAPANNYFSGNTKPSEKDKLKPPTSGDTPPYLNSSSDRRNTIQTNSQSGNNNHNRRKLKH